MKEVIRFIRNAEWLTMSVAVFVGVLFVFSVAQAATTISTNISTGGTLAVTGASTFTTASTTQITASGNVWVNGYATTTAASGNFATQGTLTVVGASTLANASTSQLTTSGNLWVNGFATTTAATGNFATQGTLTVVGASTLANASTSQITASGNVWVNGFATTTASNGNFATAGTLTVTGASTHTGTATFGGLASTTQLRVGSDQISTFSGMIFGFCTLSSSVAVAATSTNYADCAGATGVTSSYRVFVQATSSLPAGLIVDAASSTATTGTINLRVNNVNAGASTNTGTISLNFWAVR